MTGRIVAQIVSLDDLYHPETPEHYDPDCCCAYCLDVSIARARRSEAAMYKRMRREGRGKIARLLWRKVKNAQKIAAEQIANELFSSPSVSGFGGLQDLISD